MKKILTKKDKIFMGLAFLGDLAIESYSRGSGYRGKDNWLEAVLNINPHNLKGIVWRSMKVGDIEKVVGKDGNVYIKLTNQGRKVNERYYPLSRLSRRPWDNKWRIVIFDIPEKMKGIRNGLRSKLVSLGFGKVQKSVYISPLDVLADFREYIANLKLSDYVFTFEATSFVNQNHKLVASYVWGLNALEREYASLADEIEWAIKHSCSQEGKEKIRGHLFNLLLTDPCLPKELLPDDWAGNQVKRKASQLLMRSR